MKGRQTDHRVRLTKMLIRRAFTSLVKQKPIQSITVKELCQAAGVHRGTFYAHYRDIYDLMEQMEKEMYEEFKRVLEPLLPGPGGELSPVDVTASVFQILGDNADLCAVTLGDYGDKAFALRLIQLGQERCVQSYSKVFASATTKQIEYFYAFASGGCIALLQKWLAEGMTLSAKELAQMAENLMTRGMGYLASPSAGAQGGPANK